MEAEQSVIGSMIMDREAIIVASEIVLGDDFYNKQYGVLFDAMVELNDEGKPVDLVTLQDRLKEKLDAKDAMMERLKRRLNHKDERIQELEEEMKVLQGDKWRELEDDGTAAEVLLRLRALFR